MTLFYVQIGFRLDFKIGRILIKLASLNIQDGKSWGRNLEGNLLEHRPSIQSGIMWGLINLG